MNRIVNHCSSCMHSDVCKFKDKTEEIKNKLQKTLTADYPEDALNYDLVCKHYELPWAYAYSNGYKWNCGGPYQTSYSSIGQRRNETDLVKAFNGD